MSEVLPAWTAVTDWLTAHAPASHAALRPGANAADVQAAESTLGVTLPVELVTLLMASEGTVDADTDDCDPDEYDPGLFLAQHHLRPLVGVAAVRDSVGEAGQFWGSWIPFAVADYALASWSGLAIDPRGRLAAFRLSDGEPPAQPLDTPGYGSIGEFLRSLAEALVHETGPLMTEGVPGLHQGALVWGPLGEGEPWQPVHSENNRRGS